MSSWHSYPKIYNIGHSAIKELFKVPVFIEEKVDGSQFSFGLIDGELMCRSKGAILNLDAPEKMFTQAVEVVRSLAPLLTPGYTYRCEYLKTPKHNALAYERIPKMHLILFDVCTGQEQYMDYYDKEQEAQRLGLEVVPLLFSGDIKSPEELLALLKNKSVLGNVNIEGVVVKQQDVTMFGTDGKALIGKFVSEEFKEVHSKSWKVSNPSGNDIKQVLGAMYRSEARWQKAVQALRDSGQLTNSPKDIGLLIKTIHADIEAECETEIKAQLYKWSIDSILRQAISGMPQWYKEQLVGVQFQQDGE